MNNEIKIQVSQRQPIIRVIHIRGVDYYIDDAGLKVPASPNFTAHVPIVAGNIKDSAGVEGELKTQNTKDIFTLAKFIRENDFWKAQIEQVIVSPDAEFELIPKIADHVVILGTLENLETKMNKLMTFYKEGLSNVGWDQYKTINLKFEDQVVATP